MDAPPQFDVPIKTALFVDFDNIYIGLRNIHPKAAEEFATDPKQWLAWFEQGMAGPEQAAAAPQRRILLRHCYLNPNAFGNFRAYFTRSAFRVVDCPPITGQNKNSTDIYMVMDILDAMGHKTHFDEFIILSGDSDFTPVLLRLRNHDRRTVILTAGPAASAYKAASDRVVGVDAFIENGLRILPERVARAAPKPPVTRPPAAVVAPAAGPPGEVVVTPADTPRAVTPENLKGRILSHVGRLVTASAEPVHMASAASSVLKTFGAEVQKTKWAGAGTFKELLMAAGGRGFTLATDADGTGFIFDPSRHASPAVDYFGEKWKEYPEELAAFARRVNRVTGTPLLTPDGYALVFGALQEELRENSYLLTSTSRAVRERCIERGGAVPRKAINLILQGITYSGHKFGENPPNDKAEVFAEVFKDNVLKLCKGARLALSEGESELLTRWIRA